MERLTEPMLNEGRSGSIRSDPESYYVWSPLGRAIYFSRTQTMRVCTGYLYRMGFRSVFRAFRIRRY